MSTVQCKCKGCGEPFIARIADRKRGWAKCCSKTCAATLKILGQFKNKRAREQTQQLSDDLIS